MTAITRQSLKKLSKKYSEALDYLIELGPCDSKEYFEHQQYLQFLINQQRKAISMAEIEEILIESGVRPDLLGALEEKSDIRN